MPQADIGLIGLAVMGQNLVLNMNDHGSTVAVFNRTTSKVDDFMNGPAKGSNIVGTHSLEEFVGSLKRPRRVMLMVKAGEVVDRFIDSVAPLLEEGDIIIDGGNSRYIDTDRRTAALRDRGLRFIGTGISGGEEGPATARPSCPAATGRPGRTSRTSFKRCPPRPTANPAASGWVTTAPATT